MSEARDRYREEMGQDPPSLPADDPLAWQWDTRLTRKDLRERLADGLRVDDDEDEESPPVIEGQESLL